MTCGGGTRAEKKMSRDVLFSVFFQKVIDLAIRRVTRKN